MIREQTFQILQRVLIVICILISLLFAVLYIPISKYNQSLEEEVMMNYKRLVSLNNNSSYQIGLDAKTVQFNLEAIQPQLQQIRSTYLEQIEKLHLPSNTLHQYMRPFQAFEYILSRKELCESLNTNAQVHNVALSDEVLSHVPEYNYGMESPQMLWISLHACKRTLEAMIESSPAVISAFDIFPIENHYSTNLIEKLSQTNRTAKTTIKTASSTNQIDQLPLFIQIPIHVQFTGTMESVVNFLKNAIGALPKNKENLSTTKSNITTVFSPSQDFIGPLQPLTNTQSLSEPTVSQTSVPNEDTAVSILQKESSSERNNLFLGPFVIYIAPDNPDHVVFNAIINSFFLMPQQKERLQ